MFDRSHQDRIAVVTGAGRGIGQAVCCALAERGARVVAVDRDEPDETVALLEDAGRPVTGLCADVSEPEQTEEVGEYVQASFGRCDILVNNAGLDSLIDSGELQYATWRRVLAVNLDSQFLMVKALLPLMKSQCWGRIVSLTSNSVGSTMPGLTHHMASKLGGIGFTRALANEVAGFGVTVNAVGPRLSRIPGVVSAMGPELLDQVAQLQAIKHIGDTGDVVGTMLFLTSEEAAFVTGQTFMTDGG